MSLKFNLHFHETYGFKDVLLKFIFIMLLSLPFFCSANHDLKFESWYVDCEDGSVILEDVLDGYNFTRIIVYSDKSATFKIMHSRIESKGNFYKNSILVNRRMIKLHQLDISNYSPEFIDDHFTLYRNGTPVFGTYTEARTSFDMVSSTIQGTFLTDAGELALFNELLNNEVVYFYDRKIKSKGLSSAWHHLQECKAI